MSEASMPPMVLAVATKKLIKAMLKEDGGEDGAPPRALPKQHVPPK